VVDPLAFRRVVGRFPTGVTVITTVSAGEHHALTCSSFTSVSLDPVLVLFGVEKRARFHDVVLATGTWAVSVLAQGQEDLSRQFAVRGRPLEDQFVGVPFAPGPVTGAPVLDGAVAALECRTTSTVDAGDHTLVLGEVLGLSLPEPSAEPLLYVEGRYAALGDAPDGAQAASRPTG